MRQAANLAVDIDSIIKHVLNGLGDRTATVNPGLRLRPEHQAVPAGPRAGQKLADAGYERPRVGFLHAAVVGPVSSRHPTPSWPTSPRPASGQAR